MKAPATGMAHAYSPQSTGLISWHLRAQSFTCGIVFRFLVTESLSALTFHIPAALLQEPKIFPLPHSTGAILYSSVFVIRKSQE